MNTLLYHHEVSTCVDNYCYFLTLIYSILCSATGLARELEKHFTNHSSPSVLMIILPTPLKINMEHNHGGVEDHFPF